MDVPSTSLWSSLLRESSKRSKFPDALTVFLGDSDCGKTKLVDKLCVHNSKESIPSTNEYMSKEIVSYNYFETDESFSETDLPSKVGIWSISDKCFDNALQTVIRPSKTDKILFLIGIDLSKNQDDCINSLETWLRKVISFSSEYLEINQRTTLHQNNLTQYIQNIKNGKNFIPSTTTIINNANENTSNEANFSNSNSSSVKVNTGFPIIVVGCKADVINDRMNNNNHNNNDNDDGIQYSITEMKEFQGKLRTICLQFGAALIYTSATRNDKPINTTSTLSTAATAGGAGGGEAKVLSSIALLRKYIFHRLYPEVVSMNLTLEDNVESAFIPAGYDRTELIEISTGYKDKHTASSNTTNNTLNESDGDRGGVLSSIDWWKPVPSVTSTSTASPSAEQLPVNPSSSSSSSLSLVEMESEDEWLAGLQNFMKLEYNASPAYGLSPATSTASLSIATAATEGGGKISSSGGIGSLPKSRRNSGNNNNPDPSSPSSASAGVSGTQSATGTGSISTTASSSIVSSKVKRVPPTTTTATSAGQQQDVSSFFQNLLAKK